MACPILTGFILLFCPFQIDTSIPTDLMDKVMNGKPVVLELKVEKNMGGARGVIFVDSDVEKVWETVRYAEKFPEFIPALKAVSILHKGKDYEVTRFFVKKIIKFSYTTVRHFDKKQLIVWWVSKDDRFEKIDGYWKIKPLEKGVLLFYYTWLKPKIYIPDFIVNFLEKKALPKTLISVKNRAEGIKREKEKKDEFKDIPF